MSYARFVAIGDSLTLGSGDVYPDGRLRGFADLLAHSLAGDAVYANLARPSVRAHEVLTRQVPEALAFDADLITAIAGVNDVIAVGFPARRVSDDIDRIFARLRTGAPQATIVTATLPDLRHLSLLARALGHRVALLNAAIREAAPRHGVVLVDLHREVRLVRDDLALDRVHPSPSGHLRLARAFAAALALSPPEPAYLHPRPRAEQLLRLYRTAVVAPRFVGKRLVRGALIASQPAKRPQLRPM